MKDMCSDSSCDDASDAMVINALVEELALEKSYLESYHDACFAKFIVQNPCDESHSTKQRKGEYMHEQYNFNTRRLLQRQLLQSRRMPQSMKANQISTDGVSYVAEWRNKYGKGADCSICE